MPGADVAGTVPDLDLMADMDVGRVNVLTADPDRARGFDTLAAFATLAAGRTGDDAEAWSRCRRPA